jgi:hypothetical protein
VKERQILSGTGGENFVSHGKLNSELAVSDVKKIKWTFVPELHLVGLLHELAVVVVAEGAVLGVPERPDATLFVQQHRELGSAPNLVKGQSYSLCCVTGGKAVFGIRDYLVRIRILGCESVPKSSASYRMQKNKFFHIFYVLKNEI